MNLLLQTLDAAAAGELAGVPVELRSGQVLQRTGEAPAHVYFPNTAILSMVATVSTGGSVEVATIGSEGFAGLFEHVEGQRAGTDIIVQVSGTALKTTSAALEKMLAAHPHYRAVVDRVIAARLTQVTQMAACNRLHLIRPRLSRWLLALDERCPVSTFSFTQQHVANMLGVHRPTIAAELLALHKAGAIVYRGRRLAIVNRELLKGLACECLVATGAEHQRLCAFLVNPARPGHAQPPYRELAETLSHEFRSRLQAILGWCEIAGETLPADALSVIRRNAREQLTLIENLLESSDAPQRIS